MAERKPNASRSCVRLFCNNSVTHAMMMKRKRGFCGGGGGVQRISFSQARTRFGVRFLAGEAKGGGVAYGFCCVLAWLTKVNVARCVEN